MAEPKKVRTASLKPRPPEPGVANPYSPLAKDGTPAKRRFPTASVLYGLFKRIRDDELDEAGRRTRIRKVYDQYLPFDPQKLKAEGLANLANVRFGFLSGQIDRRAGVVSEWALDSTDLVQLRVRGGETAGPDVDRARVVIASEFSRTLRESEVFLTTASSCLFNRDLYGCGPLTWRDYWDYRPRAVERGNLKVLEDAPSQCQDNDIVFLETELPAWYLFQVFDDEAVAAGEGWQVDTVRQYIKDTFLGGLSSGSDAADSTGTSVEESAEALRRQNRVFESEQMKRLKVVHVYVKEYRAPFKVTHSILSASGTPEGYLFDKEGAYDSMTQAVNWLVAAKTETFLRAQRGIASKLLPVSDLNDKLLCQAYDYAQRLMTFKVRSAAPGIKPTLSIDERGPFTVFGSEAEPLQTQGSAGDLQQTLGLMQAGQSAGFAGVAGVLPGEGAKPVFSGNTRRTKAEAESFDRAEKEAEKAQTAAYVTFFDSVFRESFRRMIELVRSDAGRRSRYPGAEEFIESCEARGVPRELLRRALELYDVMMCRDLVLGGSGAKASSLSEYVTEFGGTLDERGRVNAVRDIARARFGDQAADRYRPEADRDKAPSDAASHAVLENNDMAQGQAVMVGPDQLQWSHIPVHLRAFLEIIQAAENGQVQDPQQALNVLELQSNHLREHVGIGGAQVGMDGAAKEVMRQVQSVRPVVKMLTMQAQAQARHQEAEAKARQQELEELQRRADGADAQAAMHESDNKAALKAREQDLLQQARVKGLENKREADLLREQHRAEIERIRVNGERVRQGMEIMGAQVPAEPLPVSALAGEPML